MADDAIAITDDAELNLGTDLTESEKFDWRAWEMPPASVGDRVVVNRYPGDTDDTPGIITRVNERTVHATCFQHGVAFARVALHHESDPRLKAQPHILQEEGDQCGVYRLAESEESIRMVPGLALAAETLGAQVKSLLSQADKLRADVTGLKTSLTSIRKKISE